MTGGTDQLHAPLPGPVIRLGALESRQERVVDVDHSVESIRWIKALQKCRRQHLHVLGQDHQLDAMLGKQLQVPGFSLLPVGGRDGHMGKAGPKFLGQGAKVGMVGYHKRHLHRQLARARAPQQIQQAVVLLAHEDRHRRAHI